MRLIEGSTSTAVLGRVATSAP